MYVRKRFQPVPLILMFPKQTFEALIIQLLTVMGVNTTTLLVRQDLYCQKLGTVADSKRHVTANSKSHITFTLVFLSAQDNSVKQTNKKKNRHFLSIY